MDCSTPGFPVLFYFLEFVHTQVHWVDDAIQPAHSPTNNVGLVQFSSIAQLCLTLCDPLNCSTLGLPVHHQFLEFTQTHAGC